MSGDLHVVAIFSPAPGKEDRLKEILFDLANKVYENEEGVKKYQIFQQVDSQTGTNVILFQETYADKATVDKHLSTPYFGGMNETLTNENLLTKPFEVLVINPIGGFASRV